MHRYLPIHLPIFELDCTEIFAFAMMFKPENAFGVFSYVTIDVNVDSKLPYITCLYVNNSYLICY